MEWAPIPIQYQPLAAPHTDTHLRQPGTGGVLCMQLQREQLPERSRAVAGESHVAAGLEFEAVQRCLVAEAAAIHRGG
jgi:hypothetical protein